MASQNNFIANYLGSEKGATAIEYAIIAAGIAVAITGAIALLGTGMVTKFNYIQVNVQ